MFSLDDDQSILQTPLIDTEDNVMMITLIETRDSLNLQKVKMVLPYFSLLVKI